MSMQSKLTKTLLAMTAAATLFIALPSQAGQPYCPNPYVHGYGHGHGYVPPSRRVVIDSRHRGHDHRWDGRRDYRHVGRHDDRHDRRRDRHDDRRDNRRDGRHDDRHDRNDGRRDR